MIEATNGLKTTSQNRWPSLAFDVGAINDSLAPLFVAGFYNKTFMWPKSFWTKVYEPIIRAAAGLGKAPTAPDPDRYANRHAHFDVLIVGAGPAGLAAALAASRSGRRVAIADEQSEFGGSLLHDLTAEIDGRPAAQWLAETVAELAAAANVTCLPRTTVFGYYNHNHVVSVERVADHLDAPDGRGARAAVADAGGRGRARDRVLRAPAGLRRQRPPRHHAGRERPRLRQSLGGPCPAPAPSSPPPALRPIAPRWTPPRRASP